KGGSFFFQAEDGIRDRNVTGVQTCALPILAIDQLEQLIALPHQPRKEVARWLNVIADLQIRHGADYDEVRRTLQRVLDRFPDLAAGRLEQRRIEHLRLEFKGKEKSQVVKLGSYEK